MQSSCESTHLLEDITLIVFLVQPLVAAVLNIFIFVRQLQLQAAPTPQVTREAHHLQRKFAFTASLILQIIMTVVNLATGTVVVDHAFDAANLTMLSVVIVIAG